MKKAATKNICISIFCRLQGIGSNSDIFLKLISKLAVTTAGCTHQPVVVGDRKPRDLPQFLWVNTVLGNLKTTLAGAYHSLKYRKYGAAYLAAFAYRFNRRFDLRGLMSRLIVDVARCAPAKEQVIRQHAEAGFQSGWRMSITKRSAADGGCTLKPVVGVAIFWPIG